MTFAVGGPISGGAAAAGWANFLLNNYSKKHACRMDR
jgi:hypothetical protein